MALDFSHVPITVPLVSLMTAKAHLKVTDTYHDADITQKTAAAQDAVIRWLGPAVDATWTESTLPKMHTHAILLLLEGLYEHDEDKIKAAWEVIGTLLGTSRDPTLA